MKINKVVVIGAGTMGGGIAAHCANVGLSVTLLDIPSKEGDKNAIVKSMWDKQLKLRPSPVFSQDAPRRVTLGNTDDDLAAVREADWIIEVIVEQLAPKRELMRRIEPLRKPGSIVSSNTSGIPIGAIAEGLSADFRAHFLGTHFFNPPRYLKLLEVIPAADTAPEVVKAVSDFAENVLGKTVVRCKDTPNFIANRVGTFVGQYRILAALDNDYTVEEVDALTGPFIGNPRSGTFRLSDIVGLDVWAHVTRNLRELAPGDESRDLFTLPPVAETMLQRNWLGTKTNQGFYKSVAGEGGAKEFWALNLKTLEYEPPRKVRFDVIGELRDLELPERFHQLFHDPKWQHDRGGRYLIQTTLPILAYAARRIPEIADSPLEIDNAMKHGFAAEMGPFEIWDAIGVAHGAQMMRAYDVALPTWVEDMLAQGCQTFYQREDGRLTAVYAPAGGYRPVSRSRLNIVLAEHENTRREIGRNASASLLDLGDGVLCLDVHSKGNTIDTYVFDMVKQALDLLEKDAWCGMVVGNQGKDFCLGANIGMFLMAMGDADMLSRVARDMQYTMWDLRFAPKPVVAAPRQRVLGGGAELAMTSSRIVASAETYMGLVEFGVGLIPGWGGCKELLRRNVSPHVAAAVGEDKVDILGYIQKVFETIAFAKVGESAEQCRSHGFLVDQDLVVANDEQLIGYAKQTAIDLYEAGYRPPDRKARSIYAGGRRAKAAMMMAVQQLRWGKFISAHDQLIANSLAHVLAGGDLTSPTWVTEDYILDLEREATLALLKQPKTQERIAHMLKNGKPLRN